MDAPSRRPEAPAVASWPTEERSAGDRRPETDAIEDQLKVLNAGATDTEPTSAPTPASTSAKHIHLGPALGAADQHQPRLGRMLIERGLITKDELDRALELQATSKERLGRILVEMGAATSADVARVLAENLHLPFVSLDTEPDAALLAMLPAEASRRLVALPVAQWGNQVVVAMADPNEPAACDEIEELIRRPVVTAVADPDVLRSMIARVHGERKAPQVRVTALFEFICPGCGMTFRFSAEPWIMSEIGTAHDPGRLWVWEHDPATSQPVHSCRQ